VKGIFYINESLDGDINYKFNCLEVQKNIKSLKKGAPAEYNLKDRYEIPPTNKKIRNFQINLYNSIPNKIKVLPLKES